MTADVHCDHPQRHRFPKVYYFLARYPSHRRAGLAYRACLKRSGVPLVDSPAEAEVVILHREPPSYPDHYRAYPFLQDRYVIAYAVWEAQFVPERYRQSLAKVNEIWTCSTFCTDIFQRTFNPVIKIPHIVQKASKPDEGVDQELRRRLNWRAGRFCFYAIAAAGYQRKNLDAAVRAFAGLFDPEDAVLVIKTDRALPLELALTPGVITILDHWPDKWIAALHRLGNCLVSPHCSEGWGLCISDAMAHGNLAIATGYGGNMEFMTDRNSRPVAYEMTPLPGSFRSRVGIPIDADAQWANVNERDLRQTMQKAVRDWDDLAERRRLAKTDIRSFGPDVVAKLLETRLLEIKRTLDARPTP